jgi:hypothetical protein
MNQYGLTAPVMEHMQGFQGADTKEGDLTFGLPDPKTGKVNTVTVPRKTFDDQLMPGYREFYQGGSAPVKPDAIPKSSTDMPKIPVATTKGDYDNLPSGTLYVAPDGTTRTKP